MNDADSEAIRIFELLSIKEDSDNVETGIINRENDKKLAISSSTKGRKYSSSSCTSPEYTRIDHSYQLESWDCGLTSLLIVARYLKPNFNINKGKTREISPEEHKLRHDILTNIKTKSIWTSDLIWQLQTWKNATDNTEASTNTDSCSSPFSFVLSSKNISGADDNYRDFQYYSHAFDEDQQRVATTFQQLQQVGTSMIATENLSVQTLKRIVHPDNNCIAILLLDNHILLKKHLNSMENHSNSADNGDSPKKLKYNDYAGHYVVLCGTSSNPKDIDLAMYMDPQHLAEDNSLTVNPETKPLYCFVICNPAPSSPAPYMFVTPNHFEACWKARGTDNDIIFIRKIS